jgi:hypothetical protein
LVQTNIVCILEVVEHFFFSFVVEFLSSIFFYRIIKSIFNPLQLPATTGAHYENHSGRGRISQSLIRHRLCWTCMS